jgi:hypothetical protein
MSNVKIIFEAVTQQAVAGIASVNRALDQTSRDAGDASRALAGTSQETNTLTTQVNQLSKAQDENAKKAAATKIETTGAKETLKDAAKASALLTAELVLLQKAFDLAREAAVSMGRTDVVIKIDAMTSSFNAAKEAVLSLPIAGRGIIDWFGDAAEGASNLFKLYGALAIQMKIWTGEITQAEGAQLAYNLVNAEQIELLNQLSGKLDAVTTATELLRAANRKNYDDYRASLQSGYVAWATAQAQQAGIEIPPTKDIGGRGSTGKAVVIGTGAQPEVFVPDGPGSFYPRGEGMPGGWGGGQTIIQNITVNVPVQNFLGSRGDANRLGTQLAPILARGMGSIPNGGLVGG